MSKRFGRNQKRRMREAVFHAQGMAHHFERAYQLQSALVLKQRDKIDKQQKIIADMVDVLESNSAALPPEVVEVLNYNQPEIQLEDIGVKNPYFQPGAAPKNDSFAFTRLQILVASVEDQPLRTGKHVFVKFGGKKWGYALDQQAIRSMPRQLLQERVFQALAELIANDLKKAA